MLGLVGGGEEGWKTAYPEHVLALAIEDASAGLEFLGAEESGQRDGHRVGRARHDGLRLALLLVLVLVLVGVGMLVLSLLRLLLLLCLHPLGGLSLEVFCDCWSQHSDRPAVGGQTHQ